MTTRVTVKQFNRLQAERDRAIEERQRARRYMERLDRQNKRLVMMVETLGESIAMLTKRE